MFRLLAIVSCFCVVASVALAEGDPVNGKKLAKKWDCTRCHGLSGNT
jgi:cytochrome c553